MKEIGILEYIKMKLIPEKFKKDDPEKFLQIQSDFSVSTDEKQDHKYEETEEEKRIIEEKAKRNWEKFQKKNQNRKDSKPAVSLLSESLLLKAAVIFLSVGVSLFIYKVYIFREEKSALSFDGSSLTVYDFTLPALILAAGLFMLYLHYASKNRS